VSEREQSGYDIAERLLTENKATEAEAQEMYMAAEADPFPDAFTKGWQKACLEHGAKTI
jgi:hypothetical protein